MNRDPVDRAAKQAKSSIKEAIGKLTGDTKTEAEGGAESTIHHDPEKARDPIPK